MKKLVVLLLTALMATSAFALLDEGPNSIGLYWDDMYNESATVGGGLLNAYIVIAGPTAASCGGLEITFTVNPAGGALTGTTFVVPGVDVDGTPGGVAVGFATPVAAAQMDGINYFYLGTLDVVAFGACDFGAGPAAVPSIPGYPAYLDGDDLTNIVPLNFSVDADGMFTGPDGYLTTPLATINGGDVIATEDATWTGVKHLFK